MIGAKVINVTLTITNKDCKRDDQSFLQSLKKAVTDNTFFELTINEWGWLSYEKLWRSRRVLRDNTFRDLHNSSYTTKAEFNNIVLLFIQNNS